MLKNFSHQDVYQNKFQTLIQVFYDYINKRFDKTSLVTVIELSKCLLTYDLKEINFELLFENRIYWIYKIDFFP
jgi:hypothetical protein